ncbi:MFS transporter [Nocardia sp. NPDC056100]|uniref:MFS transporter n=1 Tax=Nocardia sp. NPDC056100 TaxID=3345712 RepID=UPI0035DED7E1
MDIAAQRDPRRWLILIVLCLSTMVLVIDTMSLTVAVPAIARELDADAALIQWVLDAYTLVFAGLLLTAGSLGDRYGRRRVMIIGLLLFGAASLAAALAANPEQLIAARVGMGIGAAIIMPGTVSILTTVFAADERCRAMAVWGGVSMLGLIGGPILAGALITQFGWGAVFLINVPITVVAGIGALALLPESRGPWRTPDPIGAVLSVLTTVTFVAAVIAWPRHGFDGHTALLLVTAFAGAIGFIAWEQHTTAPMISPRLFHERNFTGGGISLLLVQLGNGGLLLVLTQYLQFVRNYSPAEVGLTFLPMALASLLCNGIAVRLGARIGGGTLIGAGMLAMAAGSALLAELPEHGPGFTVLALCVLGAGSGLAVPAAAAMLAGTLPPADATLNDSVQQAGAALGVALLGSLLADRFSARMPENAPEAVRHSLIGALSEAARTEDTGLTALAHRAYGAAVHSTFLTAAAGIAVAAIVVLTVLRERKPQSQCDFENAGVPRAAHLAG